MTFNLGQLVFKVVRKTSVTDPVWSCVYRDKADRSVGHCLTCSGLAPRALCPKLAGWHSWLGLGCLFASLWPGPVWGEWLTLLCSWKKNKITRYCSESQQDCQVHRQTHENHGYKEYKRKHLFIAQSCFFVNTFKHDAHWILVFQVYSLQTAIYSKRFTDC